MAENRNENRNDDYLIIMDMMIKQNDKKYLIIIASNKPRDSAIILIQQSCFVYCSKYILDDFKKINFFKNYLNFGLSQCIEILINLLKEKKHLIKIIEEENFVVKLNLDIEISVIGMNLNLPKEKIEITLGKDNIEQSLKNKLLWSTLQYFFKEKEEDKNRILEQENKIKELKNEIFQLKQNLEEKKLSPLLLEDNNMRNDLRKSKIINESNIKNFEFVKRRLKLFNKDKKVNFQLLYSAKLNGDKSQKFHEFCDNHRNTLVILKTDLNNIFGGFACKIWNSLELGRKRDFKSFIFSIGSQKIYNPKPDSKYHLFCSDNDGPCFYAFSVDNLCLENGGFCDEIYKCNFDSFETEYELNNGIKTFKIEELEVYEVKLV